MALLMISQRGMRVGFTVGVCDGPPDGISVAGGVGVPVGVETSHKNENKYIPISKAILDVLVPFLDQYLNAVIYKRTLRQRSTFKNRKAFVLEVLWS